MSFLDNVLKIKNHTNWQPDFQRFIRAITTTEPGPVPFGDIFADHETVGNHLGERVFDYSRMAADPDHRITARDFLDGLKYIDQTIRFCLDMGWDYAYSFSNIQFKNFTYRLADDTSIENPKKRKRYWVTDNTGPIRNWDDFNAYPWQQDANNINMSSRFMAKRVPDGMKVMVIPGGVFEWSTMLMGFTPFCMAMKKEPDLVSAVISKVSQQITNVIQDIIHEPGIGGIFMGDDLGFYSGTMVSPAFIRQKILPEMKKAIDLVHSAGKVFILHSCGNLEKIMDEIIDIGIDAKHSFEDKIMPVEQAHQRWSDRIGIVGGLDIHLLTTGTEEQVRKRTRQILDACGSKGRYVLGTGNSVANYVPLTNYRAMIDEGRKWNLKHFGQT